VPEHTPGPEEEDTVLAVEPVGAPEIDEFGGKMLASLNWSGPKRIHVVEPSDDAPRVRPYPPDDDRELHPGVFDHLGGPAAAQTKYAGDDQARDSGQLPRDQVAGRLQHGF